MRRFALAMMSLASCGPSLPFAPAGENSAPDPSILGPFEVGVRTVVFEDVRRPKEDGSPRRLVTEIWYPARRSDDPPEKYDVRAVLPPEVQMDLADVELGLLETTAVRDAEVDDDNGPYPVVLFSHGNAAVRMQSTFFTVPLASHGYVVLSPDHEGNTVGDFTSLVNDDGSVNFDIELLIESLLDRPEDLSFLLGRLERGLDPVAEIADLDHVGVAGHSFGAVTALRAAGLDERIDAVVPMAPAAYLVTWIDVPNELDELGDGTMLMGGGADTTTEPDQQDSIWDNMGTPGYYLALPTAGHFSFTDFCVLDAGAIRTATDYGLGDILEDGCGPNNLPYEEAYPVINNFGVGLFNRYLRGSTGSDVYLTPSRGEQLSAGAVLQTKT